MYGTEDLDLSLDIVSYFSSHLHSISSTLLSLSLACSGNRGGVGGATTAPGQGAYTGVRVGTGGAAFPPRRGPSSWVG